MLPLMEKNRFRALIVTAVFCGERRRKARLHLMLSNMLKREREIKAKL